MASYNTIAQVSSAYDRVDTVYVGVIILPEQMEQGTAYIKVGTSTHGGSSRMNSAFSICWCHLFDLDVKSTKPFRQSIKAETSMTSASGVERALHVSLRNFNLQQDPYFKTLGKHQQETFRLSLEQLEAWTRDLLSNQIWHENDAKCVDFRPGPQVKSLFPWVDVLEESFVPSERPKPSKRARISQHLIEDAPESSLPAKKSCHSVSINVHPGVFIQARCNPEQTMVSIVDVIKCIQATTNDNARRAWNRMKDKFQDDYVSVRIGQYNVPMANARTLVQIIFDVPGNSAKALRRQFAQDICRLIGGDETLVEDAARRYGGLSDDARSVIQASY